MQRYKDKECERQQMLIEQSDILNGTPGCGRFIGKECPFVLTDGKSNLYAHIRKEEVAFFKENGIG